MKNTFAIIFILTVYNRVDADLNRVVTQNDDGNFVITCPPHNTLGWSDDPLHYPVPMGSFCSEEGWIWDSKPIDPTCTVNILPTVRFFYRKAGNIEKCLIDMRKTAIDATNAQCIDAVLKHYENIAANKEAYFIWIVHGWIKSSTGLQNLKDSYFHKHSVNGIVEPIIALVDWRVGASILQRSFYQTEDIQPPHIDEGLGFELPALGCYAIGYRVPAVNTMLVGTHIGLLNGIIGKRITQLGDQNLAKYSTFCVGHSLGAHVCGFMGKTTNKFPQLPMLSRIIAMDPAGPIFELEDQDEEMRLNPGNAQFVEAIITNSDKAGWNKKDVKPGHRNVYINGGTDHPYCLEKYKWYDQAKRLACLHSIGIELLTYLNNESIECFADTECKTTTTGDEMADFVLPEDQDNEECHDLQKDDWVPIGSLVSPIDSTRGITLWVDAREESGSCPVERQAIIGYDD